MNEIWLIRHGETAWNRRGIMQGFTDIELDPVGEHQAREVAPAAGRDVGGDEEAGVLRPPPST